MDTLEQDNKIELGELITIDEPIDKPSFTVYNGETAFAPQGDMIAIKAKPKNGKTMLSTLLTAVILGAQIGKLHTNNDKQQHSVIYFDCEQNRENSKLLIRRIYALCQWPKTNNEKLNVYNMRTLFPEQRITAIEEITTQKKPTAIFIDGIADLVNDFNDINECQNVIGKLMKLAQINHTAVFFILHTNKNDNNMKGHLGSLACQKCTDVMQVEKNNDNSFSAYITETRNETLDNINFYVNDYGIPIPLQFNDNDVEQ